MKVAHKRCPMCNQSLHEDNGKSVCSSCGWDSDCCPMCGDLLTTVGHIKVCPTCGTY